MNLKEGNVLEVVAEYNSNQLKVLQELKKRGLATKRGDHHIGDRFVVVHVSDGVYNCIELGREIKPRLIAFKDILPDNMKVVSAVGKRVLNRCRKQFTTILNESNPPTEFR